MRHTTMYSVQKSESTGVEFTYNLPRKMKDSFHPGKKCTKKGFENYSKKEELGLFQPQLGTEGTFPRRS